MNAVDPKSTPETFFINGKNLSGSTGSLMGRIAADAKPDNGLIPVERLAVRISTPLSHWEELSELFERRELFQFEIHHGLQVRVSVMAVMASLDKKQDRVDCVVEFEVV
ncbi:MAG: hypothetical protein LIP23_00950 [Planctomycetes bacterium]|nr:hypothetical protein [Planctomycetota bacterium]